MQLIKCLATNDVYGFLEIESSTTVVKALKGTSLRKLESTLDKKSVIKSISFLLNRFNENFNASGKFTDMQIATTSMDLFDIFKYESLEDVMLMLKYARQGKIGDGKDFKLDSQTVFHKWVPEYLKLKSIERENLHKQKKGELSGMANFKWNPENLKKFKTTDKKINPGQSFGNRVKQMYTTEHLKDHQKTVKSKTDFYTNAKSDVKNQTTENLKIYLKAEKKSELPDSTMISIVENELKIRKNELHKESTNKKQT